MKGIIEVNFVIFWTWGVRKEVYLLPPTIISNEDRRNSITYIFKNSAKIIVSNINLRVDTRDNI